MRNIKTRCHFSIIFESLWKFWLVIILILLNELDAIIDIVQELGTGGIKSLIETGGLWGLAAILLLSLIVFFIQFLRWRKTWVILDDNLLIVEKNTLNKSKNTIAIENISAVNMERNLFERLVGTYRIKLDTNSMTTANETDVSIVFREDFAVAFRKTLIERMNALKGNIEEPALSEERQPDELFKDGAEGKKVFHSTLKDMIMHALYTLPIFSLIIAAGGIGGAAWYVSNFGFISFVRDFLGGFIAVAFMVIGAIYNLIKKFITYYDFTAYRDGKDLHIRCGLIKLRSYTIPVDKINAIQIEQPLISRIFKKYNVKVVTVGVGDEDGESSNITMSLSKGQLKEQLEELVPEYGWADFESVQKEERGGVTVRLVKSIKWHIFTILVALLLVLVVKLPLWAAVGIPIFGDAYINLLYALSHKASGYLVRDEGLVISGGYFQKTYMICTYKKMQVLNVTHHPAARRLDICDGVIMLLDSAMGLPYIKTDLAFEISDKIIGGTK